MELTTISFTKEHTVFEAIAAAEEVFDGLVAKGITEFVTLEKIPEGYGCKCEFLYGKDGRVFRYTTAYDLPRNIMVGRVDIAYEKPGASQ